MPVSIRALRSTVWGTTPVALACMLAVLAGPAWAQSTDPPTLRLDALLEAAQAANPALQAARLEAEARAQVPAQVGALPDPTAGVTVFPAPILTAYGAQRTQWRVEQRLPWPGTLGLRAQSAESAAQSARHEADALGLDLALQVKQAYYRLYELQQTAALVRAFQERLGAFAEAATVRYEVGRGPQGAVLQVGLEADRLRERLLRIQTRQATALQALARLTDRPDLALAQTVVVEAPPWPSQTALALDQVLQQRPEVAALGAAAAQAQAQVALARKAFYPDLGVGAMYVDVAERDVPPTADGTDAFALMLSASVPLQRGRLRARLEEAQLRLSQVEARQEALALAIRTQLAELVDVAQREAQAVELYDTRLLPQAQATVESVLAAYTTGQADYIAFLDAERARFQIGLGREEAVARYLDAVARLERAVAQTPAADLTTSDVSLRPNPLAR